jgi:hypothetical protein
VDFHDNNESNTHGEEVDPEEGDPSHEEIGSQDRGG